MGRGHSPLPRRGGGHPSPHPTPLGTFGASLLAPSALVPPLENPGYAPDRNVVIDANFAKLLYIVHGRAGAPS